MASGAAEFALAAMGRRLHLAMGRSKIVLTLGIWHASVLGNVLTR